MMMMVMKMEMIVVVMGRRRKRTRLTISIVFIIISLLCFRVLLPLLVQLWKALLSLSSASHHLAII